MPLEGPPRPSLFRKQRQEEADGGASTSGSDAARRGSLSPTVVARARDKRWSEDSANLGSFRHNHEDEDGTKRMEQSDDFKRIREMLQARKASASEASSSSTQQQQQQQQTQPQPHRLGRIDESGTDDRPVRRSLLGPNLAKVHPVDNNNSKVHPVGTTDKYAKREAGYHDQHSIKAAPELPPKPALEPLPPPAPAPSSHFASCRRTTIDTLDCCSSFFQTAVMLVILLNLIILAMETYDEFARHNTKLFQATDELFITLYTIEFLLKVYAEPRIYWKSSYNRFDFFLLVLTYIQQIMQLLQVKSQITFLRVLRGKSLSCLLTKVASIEGIAKRVDGARITAISYAIPGAGAKLFPILFIFFGHFIFTNLFIGVIIQNLEDAQAEEKRLQEARRIALFNKKKAAALARQEKDIQMLLGLQKRKGTRMSLHEVMASVAGKLRHNDVAPPAAGGVCTDPLWLRTFCAVLLYQENRMHRCQQLHFEIAKVLAHAAYDKMEGRR
eukprot:jgi/Chlat1/5598/Chrsp369S05407